MAMGWYYIVGFLIVFSSTSLCTGQKTLEQSKGTIHVKALRAYRPPKNIASFLVAPPYNYLNVEQARKIAKENPFSFLHISRPKDDYDNWVKPYDKVNVYQEKSCLQAFIEKGLLVQACKPSFYLYQQKRGDSCYWCVIGCVAINHYNDRLIKPHEAIFPKKKQALIDFIRIENAHVDPVLLMHRPSTDLDVFIGAVRLREPEQGFYSPDGMSHAIWVIDNADEVALLETIFQEVGTLYIADGHHRSTAAAHLKKNDDKKDKTGKFDYILAALIPENHVTILPYHRLVKDLNGLDVTSFLERVAKYFTIEYVENSADAQPKKQYTFGMYCDGVWYRLSIKKKLIRHYKKNNFMHLDMNLLSRYLLNQLLDIGSFAMNGRIECIGGNVSLAQLAQRCDEKKWRLAFAVFPVSTQQFTKVVDAGMLMLPKTTWFEPKLWQGLFVQMLDA